MTSHMIKNPALHLFKKGVGFVLNLFFPKKCLGCGTADVYLCPDCFNKIEISLNNTCFFCGKITWQGKICIECQKENYLNRIIVATDYKNPLVRDLIKNFKYHYVKELAQPLSQLFIKSLALCGIFDLPAGRQGFPHNAVVLPIPLYGTRMRTRGFNQAELLAQKIADYFNLPLETNILKRIVPGIPQANIKDDEKRKENIKGVFKINPSSLTRIQGTNIILIDDVSTTGATLIEATKILRNNGADEVWALVVAKG